jgi:hypothetical protein
VADGEIFQRPLYRLAYRKFKNYESLVANQIVEARPGIAAMRWYEIRRDAAGVYTVAQQGTYSPDDTNRWMGSIAQDKNGNMALGYSVSSETVFPGIRYTGRRPTDPAGQMTIAEQSVIEGTGSETGSFRWGDYSSMNIDPVDDCTFWYTNEYIASNGDFNWQTRIASFRLRGCLPQKKARACLQRDACPKGYVVHQNSKSGICKEYCTPYAAYKKLYGWECGGCP